MRGGVLIGGGGGAFNHYYIEGGLSHGWKWGRAYIGWNGSCRSKGSGLVLGCTPGMLIPGFKEEGRDCGFP